jgi:hypothetical protein
MRFTIRAMMTWVVVAAIILSVGIAVHQTVEPFLAWERSPGRIGPISLIALDVVLTVVMAAPFMVAVALGIGRVPKNRGRYALIARRLAGVLALAIGLAVLRYPVDGTRVTRSLRDGNTVAFYHQYRIWPGAHFTPCLEVISPTGKGRSYPIAANVKYHALPEMRSNGEQTMIWFLDDPRAGPYHYGYAGVWCSLNRATDEFVGARGPYPAGVGYEFGQVLR